MNDENLIPFNKRPKSEQREIQKKGVEASAKKRKAMREQKDIFRALMSETVNVRDMNGKRVDLSVEDAIAQAMLKKAMQGDVKAYNVVMDMLGKSLSAEKVKQDNKRIELEKKRIELDEKKLTHTDDDEDETGVVILPPILVEEETE